ncbi:MAG: hypothetical protein ACOC1X_04885 [Promethearchaeota archaeon]
MNEVEKFMAEVGRLEFASNDEILSMFNAKRFMYVTREYESIVHFSLFSKKYDDFVDYATYKVVCEESKEGNSYLDYNVRPYYLCNDDKIKNIFKDILDRNDYVLSRDFKERTGGDYY